MVNLTKSLLKNLECNYNNYGNKLSVDDLTELLQRLSDVYYNTGKALISDKTFDNLKDLLEKRDPTNTFLKVVGSSISGKKEKVNLPFAMGSLDKIKTNNNNIISWLDKFIGPYVLSDKLDGVSAQLYKNSLGKLFLYSRGDGKIGQDISHLIKLLSFNEKTLEDLPNNTSIRGELIISKNNFNKIKDQMANARNTVSGVVNSKTVNLKIVKLVDFVAYSIISPLKKQSDQMKQLDKWGFNVVTYRIESIISFDMLSKYLTDRREKSKYEVDGIVCVDSSNSYANIVGNPDHAFAFKTIHDDQWTITEVIKVEWNPSKDKYLKPTINIKPVNLVGAVTNYATAHNAKYIVDNVIGVGAIVKLIRSGDVIPYILEVIKPAKSGKPDLPKVPYAWNKSGVDFILTDLEGVNSNLVKIKILVHFFSTMDIKYLSEGILTKLVNNGYNSVQKILIADKKKLATIEGLGEKMIAKIFIEIDKAFDTVDLATLMASSNLFGRGIGEKKLKKVLKKYPTILYDNDTDDDLRKMLLEVEGFSDITTDKFIKKFDDFKKFFDDINSIKKMEHLEKKQLLKDNKKSYNTKNTLDGFTIVFTGFRDSDLEDKIENIGGKISGSVSGKTKILVTSDDGDKESSKYKIALEKNVHIITKTKFITKYF
jgi:NAD-dependent DNA ligase